MGQKSKDVVASQSEPQNRGVKKVAGSLPKILEIARSTGSLQEQQVRCGKSNCRCSRGELHAGYYFFWSTPPGVAKLYVRKADVPLVRSVIATRQRQQAEFRAVMRQARNYVRQMMRSALGVR